MALYDWNVCLSAVFFEVLGYTEVLLRNAIDAEFTPVSHSALAQQSWLFDATLLKQGSLERVLEAEQHLLRQGKTPTRARLVASLSFGFWRALFNKGYKQLWITHLHRAFPHGTGDRKEVARLLADLNPFRNRLAHHESIVNAPVKERHDDLLNLASLIDPNASAWIEDRSCVLEVLEWRPPLVPYGSHWRDWGSVPERFNSIDLDSRRAPSASGVVWGAWEGSTLQGPRRVLDHPSSV